jgi:hypothetical protein
MCCIVTQGELWYVETGEQAKRTMLHDTTSTNSLISARACCLCWPKSPSLDLSGIVKNIE